MQSTENFAILKVENAALKEYHDAIDLGSTIAFDFVIGFCAHQEEASKDYIVKVDTETDQDYLISVFRTNQNFGIYLPYSDKNKYGNISLSNVQELNFEALTTQL